MSAPRLMIFGATDAAAELCRLAARAGWRVVVSDPRPGEANAERFQGAEAVLTAGPDEAVASFGAIDADTFVALMTHDTAVEPGVLELALRSEAAFVGAMGSRKMQDIRRERLPAAGLTEEQVDRLAGPIGLDIGAREATETAVAVLAELIAVRNGRDGGRLVRSAGPIRGQAP